MEVANVYRATFTIGSGVATGTADLTGQGFTDLTQMVIFGSWDLPTRATDYTGEDVLVKLDFVDVNTVRATRIGTPAEVINVEAYVVEFGADTNVYTGTFSLPNVAGDSPQTATANINGGSAMTLNDLTKAFCWSTWTADDTTSVDLRPNDHMVQTRFDSTSVIGFERENDVNSLSGRWFVVESSTLTVQHLTSLFTATGNATETAAITSVTEANAFILSSFWTDEGTDNDDGLWTMHLDGTPTATQVLFTRGSNLSNNVEFETQIISDSSITAQRGQWTGTTTSEQTSLTTVDIDVAVPLTGAGHPFHVAGDEYSGGHLDEFTYKTWIPTGGTTIDGSSTAAPGAKTLGWQVVEFTAEGGGPGPTGRRVFVV